MNRSKVMKKAWEIRRGGKSWSDSLKAAWADAFFNGLDFAGMAQKTVAVSPVKPLPLNLAFDGDRALYMARYRKEAGIPA
ncbi:MAG: hypothetical protein LBQ88_09060 [Treponema sp.]|jgi:hypothetical protein|nr:hypothetical protein [Treponema sp.]